MSTAPGSDAAEARTKAGPDASSRGHLPAETHPYAAALASLGLSPAALDRLLTDVQPAEAWRRLHEGTHPSDPERRLQPRVVATDPRAVAEACRRAGVRVLVRDEPGYPPFLLGTGRPAVLFVSGDWGDVADRTRVAVVGTRAPTRAGLRCARALGRALAERGVVVVSGLADGIDAAAHRGALEVGAPVPVLGVSGAAVDARSGAEATDLARRVAHQGAVLSEVAPGTAGRRWMFAVRNRIMAAAAHVVVVVESHASGGSLHTVRAAVRLGIPVAAVPGSVEDPASEGTNQLLVDGTARAVRHADDVLALVDGVRFPTPSRTGSGSVRGHRAPRVPAEPGGGATGGTGQGSLPWANGQRGSASPPADEQAGSASPPPDEQRGSASPPADEQVVLSALDHRPVDVATVAARTGRSIGSAAAALARLADRGLVVDEHGWWARTSSS